MRTTLVAFFAIPLLPVLAAGCGFTPTGEQWSTKSQSSVSNLEPLPEAAAPPPPAAAPDPAVAEAPQPLYDRALSLIRRGAASPNALLRANSIQAMQYAPEHLEPVVAAALVDENYGVRYIAAMLIGDEELCGIAHLLEPLTRDGSASVQAAAIYGLRRCGQPVDLNPLADLILSDDPEVRGNTAMVLGRLGNRSAAPLIRQAVGQGMELVSEPRVKMVDLQMAEALVMLGDAGEIEAIRAALFAPPEQGELTALACMICGRLRDYRVVPNLVRLALQTGRERQPAEVRMTAVWALAHIDPAQAALEVPLEYVGDPQYQLRTQAALTLGEIGDEAALPYLIELLDDPSPLVQVAAAGGILQIKGGTGSERNRPQY
jgi:HEAT repeat protein